MKKLILFSGVGDTDPYRQGYDGSLLHIVRHYRPSKVYLYFTKEMYEKGEKEYQVCTRSIKAIDKSIEIEILPKPEEMIKDAHLSDIFIEQYKQIIRKIIKENEGCEILLNISSGTPAMKNTLLLLALFEYGVNNQYVKFRTLQVRSPKGRSNAGAEHEKINENTDIEHIVQNVLKDNLPNAEKRVTEIQYNDLKANFIATQIITMIEKYQYVGAELLVENHKELFSEDVILLIKHLKHRCTLNIKEADNILRSLNLEEYVISDRIIKRIVEYFNVIKINYQNQSYHDTLIMLSALIEFILEKMVEIKLNIKFEDILTDKKVDLNKVKLVMPQYYDVFDKNGSATNQTIYLKDYHYIEILNRHRDLLSDVNKQLMMYSNILKGQRNPLAHEVDIYVFNKIETSLVEKVMKIIIDNIKELYPNEYKKEYMNIYDDLNKILIKKLWL